MSVSVQSKVCSLVSPVILGGDDILSECFSPKQKHVKEEMCAHEMFTCYLLKVVLSR